MKNIYKKISWEVIKNSFGSISILLVLFLTYLYYKVKIIPIISFQLHKDLQKYIGTIFIIFIVIFVQKVVGALTKWYGENVVAKTATTIDDKLVPVLRVTLKIVVWIIALVMILPFYGINISALIATLGVGSLAIALAAQDTISNIIAGILIMVDTPFRIGDKIKIPSGEIVEVLDIGVRRSRFLSEDKSSIIIVPNLDLSKSKIVNYTYAEERLKK